MKINLPALIRATGSKRRKFVIRNRQPLKRDRDRLLKVYMQVVRHWRDSVAGIVEAYEREAQWRDTMDSITSIDFTLNMQDAADDVADTVDEAATWFERVFLDIRIAFADWAGAVEAWQRTRWTQSIFSATGVDQGYLMASLSSADVQMTLDDAIAYNVSLVRDVNAQQSAKMKDAIFRAYQSRTPPQTLAKELRDITGFGAKRVKLIAENQLTRLSGQLDRERSVQAGMTDGIYKHSSKRHPREWHRARDGKTYNMTTGKQVDGDDQIKPDDFPGQPPYCGCTFDSVLDLDAIERELEANGELMSQEELDRMIV